MGFVSSANRLFISVLALVLIAPAQSLDETISFIKSKHSGQIVPRAHFSIHKIEISWANCEIRLDEQFQVTYPDMKDYAAGTKMTNFNLGEMNPASVKLTDRQGDDRYNDSFISIGISGPTKILSTTKYTHLPEAGSFSNPPSHEWLDAIDLWTNLDYRISTDRDRLVNAWSHAIELCGGR